MEFALEPWNGFWSCQERQGQVKMQFPASLSGGRGSFRQRSSIISSPTIHQIGTSHVTGGPVAMRVSALTATNTKIYRIWSHGWCGVPAKRVLECVTIVTCFPGFSVPRFLHACGVQFICQTDVGQHYCLLFDGHFCPGKGAWWVRARIASYQTNLWIKLFSEHANWSNILG